MRAIKLLFLVALIILALISCNRDDAEADDNAVIELATVCLDELCGYVNSQGQWQIPPKFRAADPFSKEGLAKVIVKDGSFKSGSYLPSHGPPWSDMAYAGSMGLIDINGNFILPPNFGEIRSFSKNGLAAVKMNGPESEGRGSGFGRSYKWGYASTTGQLVVEARFDGVGDFSDDGLAAAQVNGRWGFIDSSGQWFIQPQFDYVKPFLSSGLALAREYKYEEPESKWHRSRSVGKLGFIDASGQWVVAPVFDRVNDFFDTGLAVAVVNDKSGMINTSGQWVIEPDFREIWFPKGSNLGQVITTSRKSALLNTSGQWITEQPTLDDLGRVVYRGEKVTSASLGGKVGIINVEKGQWLAEAKFDEISDFNDKGLATVKLNGKFGLINTDGKLIIEPQFHQLQAEQNNGLLVAGNNGRCGLINLEGKWVVEPKFDSLKFVSDNEPIAAREKGKWGMIDRKGNWTVEPKLDGIQRFYDNGLAWAQMSRGQETIHSHTGSFNIDAYHYGLINAQGQWAVDPKFEKLYFFSDQNLSYAKINDKWGVVDATGQWIIEPKFNGMILTRIGNVAEVSIGTGTHVRCYLDYNSTAYRTGSDKYVEESGFHWEFANGTRTLFNRQGKKILTVEDVGEVAKTSAGEIIWPLASASETNEDKK